MNKKHITGCILGTAVGDAMGLPYEGMSPGRAARLLGRADRYRFLFGHGMVSDDTEHTCMVTQALIDADGDVSLFARSLARRFRFWLLFVPAGVGFATLRAILKLWLGFSPENSGVFSAGNGPAMRAAILGACFSDYAVIKAHVRASTRITHTDPKAEYGALAVALAALMARQNHKVTPEHYLRELQTILEGQGGELLELIASAVASAGRGDTARQFADSVSSGKGVSGYVYQTVPVAIHVWLRNQGDFRTAVSEMVECGGDADTTAAIVGGIVGSGCGKEGIPAEWSAGLCEWPGTVEWMEQLAVELTAVSNKTPSARTPSLHCWQILPRNLFFLMIVLLNGFRRLFPPY